MPIVHVQEADFCKVTDLIDFREIIREETGEDMIDLDEPNDNATSAGPVPSPDPDTERTEPRPTFEADVSSEVWATPRALRTPSVPAFPLEALSPWHQSFVRDLADQFSCGVDGPAVMSLGVLSGALANTCATRIECDHPVQLWTLWICESGEGKSPVKDRCLRPVLEVQDRLLSAHAESVRAGRVDLLIEQQRLADAKRRAAKAEDESDATSARDDMQAISARIELLKPHRPPRLTATETSPAGLVRQLAQPGHRLILASDEASEIFGGILRRNRKQEEEFQVLLQSYSGASIEHERANGGYYIPRPALVIASAIQPDAFDRIMKVSSFHDQGLLARFLLAKPAPTLTARKPPGAVAADDTEYDRKIASLLSNDPSGSLRIVTLSPMASASLDAFASDIDGRSGRGGDLEFCRGWVRKLRGNVIRLATVLELADDVDATEVTARTMDRAQLLAGYFLAHAVALFRSGAEFLDDQNAETVLQWVRHRRKPIFAYREAVRAHSGRMRADDVADALDFLVEHGYLRAHQDKSGRLGRPRGPRYEVHPQVLTTR